MDLSLSDEQQAFRDLARTFLDKEAVPHRTRWDRDEAVDLAIVPKMAEIGFFGLTIPEEYGGLGGDYVTYALAMEELGRADSALRGIVSVSSGLVGKSILVLRHRGAEAGVAAPAGDREQAGVLRADRARHRVRRRQPHLAGHPRRRRLGDQRAEALHHQRHLGRRGPRLRPHQRRRAARRHGVPRPHRHPRLRGPRDQGQARPARPGDRRALPRRRPRPGLGRAGRGRPGLQDRDEHPRQGPARGRRRLRRASCRAAWRRPWSTPPAACSSAGRSPASSSCRT